jgi:CBS domain-containing protein
VRQALGGLRVGDLAVRDPATVGPDQTLGQLVDDVVWARRYTTYPVVEDGRPLGLLPFRALAAVPRREWDGRRVREAMLPADQVPALAADDDLFAALGQLSESEIGRGLVLDAQGRLAGLLSITDIARALDVGGPRHPEPRLRARGRIPVP